MKKPGPDANIVNLSTGPLRPKNMSMLSEKPVVSWRSEIGNKANGVSGLSDIESMRNMIAEKTSYADSNTLVKTHTQTYVLGHLPKALSFVNLNNNDDILMLLLANFNGSWQIQLVELCVLEKWSFNSMKLFTLDIKFSAMSRKHSKIIRASFTFESSINKIKDLTIHEKIMVNDDLRKINSHLDKEIIVKKIFIDLPKSALELVFSKFDITVHDLSDLLESYGKKTCFIGCNSESYVHDRCTVVCFDNETFKLAVIGSILVYKDQALIARSVSFGDKIWAQIVGSTSFHVFFLVVSGAGLSAGVKLPLSNSNFLEISCLNDCLAFLECFLEFLSDQVSDILKKLSFVELVPLTSSFCASFLTVFVPVTLVSDSNMAVNDVLPPVASPFLVVIDKSADNFGPSSLKILTSKIGSLKSKMVVLEALVNSVLAKLDILCLSLGFLLISPSHR
ncbi:hypothetical protein G9A89_005619 [Geosiphon pyriformis]|nr:hypothetical protein G9A89_005619 [Geosiphon pyriformis]